MRAALPLAFAVVLLACSTDSGEGSCPSDGDCSSTVRGKTVVTLKAAELASATVQGCKKANGANERACSKGTSGTVPTSTETITFVLDGAIPATAYLTKEGSNYAVEVSFSVESQGPTNGDEFSIEVLKADQTSAKSVVRVVTYTTVAPNGPSCLPICKTATFGD